MPNLLENATEVIPPQPPLGRVELSTNDEEVDAALGAAPAVNPSKRPRVKDLSPLAAAGVSLAKLVLWFIAIATVLLLGLICLEEFSSKHAAYSAAAEIISKFAVNPPDFSVDTQVQNYQKSLEAAKAMLSALDASQEQTRDFVMKVAQLILISILLPVLTALLGYIFGTQQSGEKADE